MILSAEAADWSQWHEKLLLSAQNQADTKSQQDRCFLSIEQSAWHNIWHEWHIQQLSENHEHIIHKNDHHSHTNILKCLLLSETVSNCSYNDIAQVWKE